MNSVSTLSIAIASSSAPFAAANAGVANDAPRLFAAILAPFDAAAAAATLRQSPAVSGNALPPISPIDIPGPSAEPRGAALQAEASQGSASFTPALTDPRRARHAMDGHPTPPSLAIAASETPPTDTEGVSSGDHHERGSELLWDRDDETRDPADAWCAILAAPPAPRPIAFSVASAAAPVTTTMTSVPKRGPDIAPVLLATIGDNAGPQRPFVALDGPRAPIATDIAGTNIVAARSYASPVDCAAQPQRASIALEPQPTLRTIATPAPTQLAALVSTVRPVVSRQPAPAAEIASVFTDIANPLPSAPRPIAPLSPVALPPGIVPPETGLRERMPIPADRPTPPQQAPLASDVAAAQATRGKRGANAHFVTPAKAGVALLSEPREIGIAAAPRTRNQANSPTLSSPQDARATLGRAPFAPPKADSPEIDARLQLRPAERQAPQPARIAKLVAPTPPVSRVPDALSATADTSSVKPPMPIAFETQARLQPSPTEQQAPTPAPRIAKPVAPAEPMSHVPDFLSAAVNMSRAKLPVPGVSETNARLQPSQTEQTPQPVQQIAPTVTPTQPIARLPDFVSTPADASPARSPTPIAVETQARPQLTPTERQAPQPARIASPSAPVPPISRAPDPLSAVSKTDAGPRHSQDRIAPRPAAWLLSPVAPAQLMAREAEVRLALDTPSFVLPSPPVVPGTATLDKIASAAPVQPQPLAAAPQAIGRIPRALPTERPTVLAGPTPAHGPRAIESAPAPTKQAVGNPGERISLSSIAPTAPPETELSAIAPPARRADMNVSPPAISSGPAPALQSSPSTTSAAVAAAPSAIPAPLAIRPDVTPPIVNDTKRAPVIVAGAAVVMPARLPEPTAARPTAPIPSRPDTTATATAPISVAATPRQGQPAVTASPRRTRIETAAGDIALASIAQPHAAPATTAIPDAPLDMGRHGWPQAMIDRIEALRDAADAVDTSIRIVPDKLGTIEISVRRDGDVTHVHFNAEQAQTRNILADAQPRLAELADARGLRLGQSSIDSGAGQQQPQHNRAPQTAFVSAAPARTPRRDTAATTDHRIA